MAKILKLLLQCLSTPLPSALRVWIYRCLGARIGEQAQISPFAILVADHIELGPCAKIKPLTIIFSPQRFSMGAYAVISFAVILHGHASFRLGARSHLGALSMVDLTADVTIGEYVGIAPRVDFLTHSSYRPASWGYTYGKAAISVGDLVFLGFNARLGHGVNIAAGSTIIPGSVILKNIATPSFVYDSPLRRLNLPLAFSKKAKISRAYVEECIRQALHLYYTEKLAAQGFTWEDREGGILLASPRIRIFAALFTLPEGTPAAGQIWQLGYNLPDESFSVTPAVMVFDFLRLLTNDAISPAARQAATYLQNRFGYRFAAFRHRGEFTLQPPQLEG